MLTKMKLALAIAAPLVAGAATYAVADSGSGSAPTAQTSTWQARHQAMLDKYDTNHDGKLDASERAAMRDDKLTARFQKLDANHDGVVTLDEFKANAKLGHRHGRHMHQHLRDTSVPGSSGSGGSGS